MTKQPSSRRLKKHPKGWGRGRRSKMVVDRIKDSETLRGSVETFKNEVAARVRDRLSPYLHDGETVPDHGCSLDLVCRRVEAALGRLESADGDYAVAALHHAQVSRERQQWAREEVYPRVVDARRSIDHLLGKEEGRLVHGMTGKTRRKPDRQQPQVKDMVLSLSVQPRELPVAKLGGDPVDPGIWLREVEPPYRRLVALTEELTQCELEMGMARDAKEAEMKAFDAEYADALSYAIAVYRLAGCSRRVIHALRSYVQRRRLRRWARAQREARLEQARRVAGRVAEQAVRATTSAVVGWWRRFRPTGGPASR